MEIDDLRAEVAYLKEQNQLLQEQVKYLSKKLYGKSSEQIQEDGQTSLFGDDDNGVFEDPESTGEQIKTVVVRQKKRKSSKTKITKELSVKEEVIHLEDDHCDRCGEHYDIFKKKVGRKLHYQPAELYIVQQYKEVGTC